MLNEAYALWQACERCGIGLPERVPGFDEGQKADGIRVYISENGGISRIEAVPAEQIARVRKWKCGEGITLPVFNFEPLHDLPADDSKKLRRAFLKRESDGNRLSLSSDCRLRWKEGPQSRLRKLQGAFQNVAEDLNRRIGVDQSIEGEAWRQLLNRLSKMDAEKFLRDLSKAVRRKSASNAAESIWFYFLYNNNAKKAKTIPVQFEPDGDFKHPVFSSSAQMWLKDVLLRSLGPAETSTPKRPAVWGDGATADEKFRDVSLPIGKVSLFNKDSGVKETSARYGVGGPESFRVGNDVRMKLMASLEWLCKEERKRATWITRQLPNGNRFLLLAYPTHLSETPPRLACLFGGDASSEASRAELRFESVSESVIAALHGIVAVEPKAQVNVFAIYKPDLGRAQVFFSEVFSATRLRELAIAWQHDARQHPPILIPQFPRLEKEEWQRRKKEKISTNPEDFEPAIPFPYEVVECLNTIWEKCTNPDETKADEAQDVGLSDAFELLRSTRSEADPYHLTQLLELAVRRAMSLLLAVGQAAHQSRRRVLLPPKASAKCTFQSLRWPSIFGLFLTRLNYKLEVYMHEPAYLIGRLLAQVDRLHSYYALHVSGKEQMRQLLGNSIMPVALEEPRRAFELLGQRILPYQAWAMSFSRGKHKDEQKQKDASAVGGILWELGRIAAELAERTIPEQNLATLPAREGHESRPPAKHLLDAKDYAWMSVGPAAKAQMLLGYLSRPSKKPSGDTTGGEGTLSRFEVDSEEQTTRRAKP